jgi:hypothetical protein
MSGFPQVRLDRMHTAGRIQWKFDAEGDKRRDPEEHRPHDRRPRHGRPWPAPGSQGSGPTRFTLKLLKCGSVVSTDSPRR